MEPINPGVRRAIWDGMWHAERQARYYYAVYQRYARWHNAIVGATLLLGTAAVGSLVEGVPNSLLFVVALPLAVLTVWSAVGRYAEKSAMASFIHLECNDLQTQFRALMTAVDAYELDTDTARSRGDSLVAQLNSVTGRSTGVGLVKHEKLAIKAENQATQELRARYGSNTTAATAT